MNRIMRRNQKKLLKSKLTPEQYEDLKGESVREAVEQGKQRTLKAVTDALWEALCEKELRISEERRNKIIDMFYQKVGEKYKEGEQDERLS